MCGAHFNALLFLSQASAWLLHEARFSLCRVSSLFSFHGVIWRGLVQGCMEHACGLADHPPAARGIREVEQKVFEAKGAGPDGKDHSSAATILFCAYMMCRLEHVPRCHSELL